MEINVARISKSEGIEETFSFSETFSDSEIKFGGEQFKIVSPVNVSGSAVNYGGKINVDFDISAKVERNCSRCLEPFIYEVETSCSYVFVKGDVKNVNEDVYYYKNDRIDITDIVLGEIAGQLPMKPLCDKDCMGLCPTCGKNKNIHECECKTEDFDPRLQILGRLFDRE